MPSIFIRGIGHPSTCRLRAQCGPANTAGPRASPIQERCHLLSYVCVPFNNSNISPRATFLANSVEMTGFEPVTFALQRRCSPAELHPQDLPGLVGLTGFEPVTPVLSGLCSNQLSYKPRVQPSTTEK